MTYHKLYDFVQELTPKIRRPVLLEKTLELTKSKPVKPVYDGMDPEFCRGYFISAKNPESRFVQQMGGNNVIVIARNQSYCWQRFVFVKELMHLFDSEEEETDDGEKFERVLSELSGKEIIQTPQTKSEVKCFWMALALTCPEKHRQQFMIQRDAKHIDDYGIASQLKIPEQHIYRLFQPEFPKIIQSLLD